MPVTRDIRNRRPPRKVHCLWQDGQALCRETAIAAAIVTPHEFFRIEQRDGYAHVCRHCARELHRLVSSLTRFGVAMRIET